MTTLVLPPHGLTNWELAHMPDELLLKLQVSTLAIPADLRTDDDLRLLDRLGNHWRARKSPGPRLVCNVCGAHDRGCTANECRSL